MASYGYGGSNGGGGGYSTTSYGAQGGAEGGGFMGGASQQGSQDGGKSYGKDTLRPVTIKQIIDATQAHPDAAFEISGVEVSTLTFIGQIQSVSPQATNTTFKLDDGTSLIEVKQWIDSDADPDTQKALPKEGDYIRVFGNLKDFNGKRHIGARHLRPIANFNEINYHFLEATATHLFFTRGLPDTSGAKNDAGGMFVDSGPTDDAAAAQARKNASMKMSPGARKVFQLLQNSPQSNEGLNAHTISSLTGMGISEVWKAGDELLGVGMIYTTLDDETWAVLEM